MPPKGRKLKKITRKVMSSPGSTDDQAEKPKKVKIQVGKDFHFLPLRADHYARNMVIGFEMSSPDDTAKMRMYFDLESLADIAEILNRVIVREKHIQSKLIAKMGDEDEDDWDDDEDIDIPPLGQVTGKDEFMTREFPPKARPHDSLYS